MEKRMNNKYGNCLKCGKEKSITIHKFCRSCSKIGRKAWNKGFTGFMKGRKVSLETRSKQSSSQLGDKNHNWKGGITYRRNRKTIPYLVSEWRKNVIERDKSICTICKKFCFYPQTHHVRHATEHPELIYDVSNGRTVCYDCHMIIHNEVSYYRKRGEFRGQLEQLTLSQAWKEISLKVQRILSETKELYSMSVMTTRAPCSKEKIYAELIGDNEKLRIKNLND